MRGLVAGLVFASAVMGCKTRHAVVMRNSTTMDVTATLDGKTYAIPPNQVRNTQVEDGNYEIAVTGGWNETERFALAGGRRHVVYNIGGAPDLALVSVGYGSAKTTVRPLTTPLTVLEPHEHLWRLYVNEKVPKKAVANSSESGTTIYYLCTYDARTEAVGCPIE